MTHNQRKASGVASSLGALAITKGIQIWGVYLASKEIGQPGDADEAVLAFCALLFLGTQVAEDIVLRIIDRFFGAADDRRDGRNGS